MKLNREEDEMKLKRTERRVLRTMNCGKIQMATVVETICQMTSVHYIE